MSETVCTFGTFSKLNDEFDESIDINISIKQNEEEKKFIDRATTNTLTETIINPNNMINKSSIWSRLMLWSPLLTYKQLMFRDRETAFYALDAFRAMAYLWVQQVHVQDGLKILFNGDEFVKWLSIQSKSINGYSSSNGVTVFFVIRLVLRITSHNKYFNIHKFIIVDF